MQSNTASRGKYLIIGVAAMLIMGTIYTWSYFKTVLASLYPVWNQKQLSLTFTIMMICFALGGLLGGKLTKSLGHGKTAMLSGILMLLGFEVAAFLPEVSEALALPMLYVFYGGCTGLGCGIGYNAVLSGVNSWFPDRDGFISGVLLFGFGLSSLLLANAAAALLKHMSLFTLFRILGLLSAVILLIAARILRLPGEDDKLPAPAKKKSLPGARDYTTAEMIRRPTFWIYFLWNLCMSATGMLVINNASSITVFFGAAATIGMTVSIFNSGGRLLVGALVDKCGWKATMFINNGVIIAAGVLMVLGNSVDSFALVLIGMLLTGICYGGGVTIQASLVRTFYGNESYAMNFSTCNLVSIPAAIIGPMISAALVDAAGGSFGPTFVMVVVMGCLSLVLNLFVRKP